MTRRWLSLVAAVCVSLLLAGCGSGDDDTDTPSAGGPTTVPGGAASQSTGPTTTTRASIEGVQTFQVVAGHSEGPLTYPEVPPVGGIHNAVWQQCGFYDQPVQNEKAVHSLEHGAIWITYRPDLRADELRVLARLADSREKMLVSRWDERLPAPIVVSSWERQLKLASARDPRLVEFAEAFVGQAPEPDAQC